MGVVSKDTILDTSKQNLAHGRVRTVSLSSLAPPNLPKLPMELKVREKCANGHAFWRNPIITLKSATFALFS